MPGVLKNMMQWWHALDVRWLQRLVVLGLVVRIVLVFASDGSNDIRTWERFGREIFERGLIEEYVARPRFNHPPLMGVWSVIALGVAKALGVPFAWVFKLLPLAADVFAIPVVVTIVRGRGGSERAAWQAAALFAMSLVAVLVTSYHGNTDSVCAFLVLLAIFAAERNAHPFTVGFIFAASLNVKLIPLVLGPALFVMQATSPTRALWWCGGLAAGLSPFLFPLLKVGEVFYRNAIAYNSFPNRWGIHFFLDAGFTVPGIGPVFKQIDAAWAGAARWVIMGVSTALGLWGRMRRVPSGDIAAMAIAAFLVLAPGIGVQYFVFPTLLLIVSNPRRGFVYGTLAGVFILCVYVHFSPRTFPLSSSHTGRFPVWAGLVGIPVWLALLESVVHCLRVGARASSPTDPVP